MTGAKLFGPLSQGFGGETSGGHQLRHDLTWAPAFWNCASCDEYSGINDSDDLDNLHMNLTLHDT